MKPILTLVLIADDGHARFVENRGVGKGLREIATLDAAALDSAATRYADRQGRSQAAPGVAVHALERSESEERQARRAFAGRVLDRAEKIFTTKGYDRFAICAPPKMLGELRSLLGGPLAEHLHFDLDKDLVKTPVGKLGRHLADHMAV